VKSDKAKESEEKLLKDPDMLFFRGVHTMLNRCPDKTLVNVVHNTALRSSYVDAYCNAMWLMLDTGEMTDKGR
jgi:hypothetical protein